jgi:hypothetical protein
MAYSQAITHVRLQPVNIVNLCDNLLEFREIFATQQLSIRIAAKHALQHVVRKAAPECQLAHVSLDLKICRMNYV